MFLKRRVFQLGSKVNDIIEESELTVKLLDVLNKHSAHLMSTIVNISSPEAFSNCYCQINSSLFKYKELLTRINCELEMIILAEAHRWEVENNFSSNLAICGNAEKDKIFTENSCLYMERKLPDNSEQSTNNNSYNFLKNGSKLKFYFNKNITAHSSFQSLNDSETIQRYSEQTLNLIAKDIYNKIKERIFSNLSPSISDSQQQSDNVNIENSRMENYELENVKSKEANCEIFKITSVNFDKILNFNNKIKNMKISELPDAEYPCIIGNTISPTEFYIYFTTDESFLLLQCDKELKLLTQNFKLSKNLTNLKDCLCSLKKKENLKQSEFYALFYSEIDDTFHRVKIKNEILDEVSKVNIILIDYGLTINNVCLEKLYLMPDHFLKYPAFAIRCHLSEETVPDLNASINSELLKVFNNWIIKNQKVIVVIDKNENDKFRDSLPVKIYNLGKNECLNLVLKNYLEENKMSKMEKKVESSQTNNVKNDELEEWNPMKEDFNSNMNSYEIDIEDPAIAIYGYVGKDYERICSLYENRGICFKGISCKKEHVKMNPDGYTTDKEEIYKKAFKVLKIPNPDDVLNVTVTHIVSGTEFYCVANKLQNDYEEETLSSLVDYMNIEYNISKMKRLTVPPSVGQVVIGKFKGDDSWYRAKVIDVAPEKDEYNLYFVDYGNSETVSYSDIRAIEVQYLHLPFQAIHCVLHGVRNSCPLSEESKNYIQNVIAETVKIKVVSVFPGDNYQLIVKAYNKNGDEVADNLIKKEILSVDNVDDMIFSASANTLPG